MAIYRLKIVIFHSYVKLPEGTPIYGNTHIGLKHSLIVRLNPESGKNRTDSLSLEGSFFGQEKMEENAYPSFEKHPLGKWNCLVFQVLEIIMGIR